MTPHISVIDWAFQAFRSNEENEKVRRCKVRRIRPHGTDKVIDPDMFIKKKVPQKKDEVWS